MFKIILSLLSFIIILLFYDNIRALLPPSEIVKDFLMFKNKAHIHVYLDNFIQVHRLFLFQVNELNKTINFIEKKITN